ncbi:MAG TPA: hypothetical protein VFW34_09750 [Candidatus Rubrimentiphilum sp.]|nr:hypothetical protein [Candidatus Rubrimentiphilum sp.]
MKYFNAVALLALVSLAGCGGSNGIAHAPIGGPPACNITNIINTGFNFDWTCWARTPTKSGTLPGFPTFTLKTSDSCVPSQAGNPFAAIETPAGSAGYLSQQFIDHGTPQSVSFRVWGGTDPVTVTVGIVFPTGILEGAETILDTFTPPTVRSSPTTCNGGAPITKTYSFSRSDFGPGSLIEIRLHVTSNGVNDATANFDDITSSP